MSDLIDGVAVEFFDIDYEIAKMKVAEESENMSLDDLMDDDSGEDNWVEREEEHYLYSFGE